MPKKAVVLAIGALPPPAIGPTMAMERFLRAANLRTAFDLVFIDISDRREPGNIGSLDLINIWLAAKHIAQCFVTLLLKRPAIIYLNISQGVWGYLRDLGFIVPALLMRRKVVIHLRGSEFGTFYASMPGFSRLLTRTIFKYVCRVVVLGERLKFTFKGLVPDDCVAVVPNGINYRQFDSVATYTARKSGQRILHVSGLRRRKGVLELLQALPAVLARWPEAHLTVVGQWQDLNDERQALAIVESAGLNEHVTFTGEVTGAEKLQLYNDHDLFVFTPIEPEGLPWVILEAMSARLPVVSSDQGAIAEVVEDGKTGFIVAPRPEAIAEKVSYLLSDREQARNMGMNGRRRVEERFSEDTYFRAIEQVFHEALSS